MFVGCKGLGHTQSERPSLFGLIKHDRPATDKAGGNEQRMQKEQEKMMQDKPTAQALRGFAAMSLQRRRDMSSKGGRTSQARGTAHQWTVEEARAAGQKSSGRRKQTTENAEECSPLSLDVPAHTRPSPSSDRMDNEMEHGSQVP